MYYISMPDFSLTSFRIKPHDFIVHRRNHLADTLNMQLNFQSPATLVFPHPESALGTLTHGKSEANIF